MLLNVQLQFRRSTLKQVVRSVLHLLWYIFWLVWPEDVTLRSTVPVVDASHSVENSLVFTLCAIRTTSSAFSILNPRKCVASWNCAVGFILTSTEFVIFFSPMRPINPWWSQQHNLRDRDNPHGTVESNYQRRFSVNVWCGVFGDQFIGLYIFPQRLSGEIYANFLQDELPALIENVPLQTRWQIYYQHDGAPPRFDQVVRQYLNHKFPNQWIGRACTQNWPPRSPDLNPLDYHVCGVTWKLWCMQVTWTQEKNYSSEFSALQEASTTLQYSISLQVLWLLESENVSKQMEDTLNNLFECGMANL